MRILRRMCQVTKFDRVRNERTSGINKSGGNSKESPGKKIEVVWACDGKIGAQCRTVLHGGVRHRTSTPHESGNKMKKKIVTWLCS